jgi:beta-glucosidase
MKRASIVFIVLLPAILFTVYLPGPAQQTKRKDIYHSGWIDLNKNGRMDIYENPKVDVERRITDLLSQMTVEEKTCQTATLYG